MKEKALHRKILEAEKFSREQEVLIFKLKNAEKEAAEYKKRVNYLEMEKINNKRS
jgi:hypothetical protein